MLLSPFCIGVPPGYHQNNGYFLSRTPAPPPFWGMNCTPADSRAARIS